VDGPISPFDASRWSVVPGFDDLTDVTYHRAVGDPGGRGTIRIVIDRSDIRRLFGPRVGQRQCPACLISNNA